MSKSVTLTFGEPEAPAAAAKTSKPLDPAAFTREERSNNNWHVRLLAWVLGLPSILSIGFVGLVGLYYAFITTGDAKTWLALSAGILIVTLFTAGLPIGAALNRETEPGIAKAAFGFWVACLALLFAIMVHFAWHAPEPAPATPAPVAALEKLPVSDPDETDIRIEELRGTVEEARVRTPDDARRLESIKAELRGLERQRYGRPVFQAPVTPESPAAPIPAPGLDLAAVALLMLTGAALGLLISASALASILTEKAATVRAEAEAAPAPAPQPAHSPITPYHPGETADGFEAWALRALSKLDGAKIKTNAAYSAYLAYCARNDFNAPLDPREFGRRLRAWIVDTFGVDSHHSNGTTFDGVALSSPAMNGAAL